MRTIKILIAVVLVASMAYSTYKKNNADRHLSELTGRPDIDSLAIVLTPEITDGIMLQYPGFDIYFSPQDHQPYYGAWILTGEHAEARDIKRTNNFRPDPNVAQSATPKDYRASGYDRGHIVPAGDNRYNLDAMEASFFMTNMSPQANDLNSKTWNNLEANCRQWAVRDSIIVIVAGPILTDYLEERIGDTGVIVPDRFFKVVLAPFADPPRAIGFVMKNGYNEGGVQATAMTVDQVEEITGFDFFSSLPDEVENAVESQTSYSLWQHTTYRHQ